MDKMMDNLQTLAEVARMLLTTYGMSDYTVDLSVNPDKWEVIHIRDAKGELIRKVDIHNGHELEEVPDDDY